MSLLHGAHQLRRILRLELHVAHVDHCLRRESRKDAELVAETAAKLGLRFHLKVAEHPPRKGENVEAWGRKLRYSFFREVLASAGLDWVVTAHTADDVAETYLMRIVANKEPRSIEGCDPIRRCLRPLLKVPRAETERYAKNHHLLTVHDCTNEDTKLLRNRVRRLLIPYMEQHFDPRIREVLASRALGLAEDVAELYRSVEPVVNRLKRLPFASRAWRLAARKELRAIGPALRWRLCESLFQPKLGFSLGREASQRVVRLFMGQAVAVELPGGWNIRSRAGGFVLKSKDGHNR